MQFDLLFKNFSRHIALSPDEQAVVQAALRLRSLARKEMLLQEGETARFENFVLEGCLKAYTLDENGFEHILHFCPEDWWISDLHSFLTGTPATLFIEAIEPSVVVQIEKERLEELYRQVPKLERFFRIMLQNAFVALQQRILTNIGLTADDRYAAFLKKYPGLEQRLPQYLVASYLGITPEFLSKIRAKHFKK